VTLPAGATQAVPVAGGDVNDAWRVRLADGTPAFVKTRSCPGAGEYRTEAAGLAWLAQPGVLAVPRVLECADEYLVLEWIEPGTLSKAGEEELGRGLALLHAAGAASFGGERPLRIGPLELPNEPLADWPSFYARRRLAPLGARAGAGAEIERVCERIEELAGPAQPPARVHGDLWGGNVLADRDGRPWLIDPAAYGGHPEVDLAMLELFGGLSARTRDAYAEVTPPADGFAERVALWQLFPLLVHAVLFGGSYVRSVKTVAQRYV
jgi:fructosamine-3-kinase